MNKNLCIAEIISDSFGSEFLLTLFSAISGRNPSISFRDQKTAFFSLVEYLLTAEKIIIVSPDADCYVSPENPMPSLKISDPSAHWNNSTNDVIEYLRSCWPENAEDENDPDLIMYFYEMPGLIWIGANN